MPYQTLPINHNNSIYFFERISGTLLLKQNNHVDKHSELNEKVADALFLVNQPYQLQKIEKAHESITHIPFLIKLFAKLLVFICKHSFFVGSFFSLFSIRCFQSTQEALVAFQTIFPPEKQKDLCYPRSLFAASLSKSFPSKGVMFIGVFLPSKLMHAWIIENGTQPDPYDTMWINFQPVAAFY